MLNWIVSVTLQYLKLFNSGQIKLMFSNTNTGNQLTVCKQMIDTNWWLIGMLYSHIYIQIYRNIIKHNLRTSMNERTHFFIKNISLTLYSRKDDVVCERWAGNRDRLLYWPKVLLTIAALLSHPGWAAQPCITEGRKPSVCKLIIMLAFPLQLTQTVCALVILLFNVHLLLPFFCLFTQVHLLIDGSIEGQYITGILGTDEWIVWSSVNTWNH